MMFIFALTMSYVSHMLTLLIMRYRHAGKVCSGDYIADSSTWTGLFATPQEPYLLNTGSFLQYAGFSQLVLFVAFLNGFVMLITVCNVPKF